MISRFDHAVIAVRDLDQAIERYRAIGFDVQPGGRHTGIGTHNALVRFGLDYLELISVYDADEAKANPATANVLLDFFAQHEGGLVGYGLATTEIQQEAEHLHQNQLAAYGPFAMQREQPDGHLLTWSLLIPNGLPWCQPWPFFIQWNIPDEQRLTLEKPGTHQNGVTGCQGIAIAVRNLESMVNLYQRQLGLELVRRDSVPALAAQRATFHTGTFKIDLLDPYQDGPVQQHILDTTGEMPFELRLAVKDLEQTHTFFTQHNLKSEPDPTDPTRLLLAPQHALSTRLVFS